MRLLARAAGLAVLVAIAVTAPATAAYPGRNGSLLDSNFYCSLETSGGCEGDEYSELDAFRLDGNRPKLNQIGDELKSPVWSPKGRRLAVRLDGTKTGIYVFQSRDLFVARAGSRRPAGRLVPGTENASQPSWSPDGKRLAFILPTQQDRLLYHSRLDGTDRRLAARGAFEPAWGPRGTIAYHTAKNLRLVEPDGSRNRALTFRGGFRPNWSPTGRRLVYSRGNDIYVIRATGGKARRLARDADFPQWSPDGRLIAFTRARQLPLGSCEPEIEECLPEFAIRLVVISPDGTGKRTVLAPRKGRGTRRRPLSIGVLEDWRPAPR